MIKKLKIWPIWICLFFLSVNLNAQNSKFPRLIKFPVLSSEYIQYAKTDFDGKSKSISEWRSYVQVGFPILKKQVYFIPSVEYHTLKESTDQLNSNYRAYIFNLGVLFNVKKDWQVTPYFSARFGSDYKDKGAQRDLFYSSSLLVSKRQNDNLLFGAGIYNRNGYESSLWLPVLQFTYKYNKWLTNIFIPFWIEQYYDFSTTSRLGVKVTFRSNLFNHEENSVESEYNSKSFNTTTVGGVYRHKVYKQFYFFVEGGVQLGEFLEYRNTRVDIPSKQMDGKPSPYMCFSLKMLI